MRVFGFILFAAACSIATIIALDYYPGPFTSVQLIPPGVSPSAVYAKDVEVILFRDGQMRTSKVRKLGSRCWAAWYEGIEKLALTGSGLIKEGPHKYRWTINRPGPDDFEADRQWFRENCVEPLS